MVLVVGAHACAPGDADTDLPLDSLPEGAFFRVSGRGYELDADWGPTSSTELACVRHDAFDSVDVSARGVFQSETGDVDNLYVRVCGVSALPPSISAATLYEDSDEGGCFHEPLWDGAFRERNHAMYVFTYPVGVDEKAECRMRGQVTATEFRATFACPWWGDLDPDPADRGEPVSISGTIRCELAFD